MQKTRSFNEINPALLGSQSDFDLRLTKSLNGFLLYSNYSALLSYNLSPKTGVAIEANSFAELNRKTWYIEDSYFSSVKFNINRTTHVKSMECHYGGNIGYFRHRLENPTIECVPSTFDTGNFFSLDLGALCVYKRVVFGLSSFQINKPNYSLGDSKSSRQPRHCGFVGYTQSINKFLLSGIIKVEYQEPHTSQEFQVNAQYKYLKLGIGQRTDLGAFENTNNYNASLGLQFNKISLSYSYQSNNASTYRFRNQIHQMTAAWHIKGLKNNTGLSRFINAIM
ncbi:MAG: type IX secretion system membrane protein PorP/SprF [Bacteroidia bacterium]